MPIPVLIGLAIAGTAAGNFNAIQAASQQKKSNQAQIDATNALASENRTNAAKVTADAAANAKALQTASVQAEEDSRKEEMRRRAQATKTLLSGSGGDLSAVESGKKVLLGA